MPRTGGISLILGVGLLAASATVATAQQPSVTKITSTGQSMTSSSSRVVHVVVNSVNGNKVVATDTAGKATEYTIPDGFKFQLDGKDIGVADLKPGQHVTATITTTTTTTPVYVTEIKSGKVLAVSGQSIIVRGPHGNQVFSNQDAVKRNATIMKDGQKVQISDLRVGDIFTAVIVTDEAPKVVSEREVEAMVHSAPEAAAAPAGAPASAPTAAAAAAPAGAPASAPAEAPTAAAAAAAPADTPASSPASAPAPAPETAPASGFPTWLILLILLIVIIIIVMFTRRRKSS